MQRPKLGHLIIAFAICNSNMLPLAKFSDKLARLGKTWLDLARLPYCPRSQTKFTFSLVLLSNNVLMKASSKDLYQVYEILKKLSEFSIGARTDRSDLAEKKNVNHVFLQSINCLLICCWFWVSRLNNQLYQHFFIMFWS